MKQFFLRKIGEKNCPHEILLKVEQGRDTLIKLFRSIAINFMANYRDVYFTVLIDHDSRVPAQDINNMLKGVIEKNNIILFSKPEVTKVTEDIQRCDLFIQKKVQQVLKSINNFSITSFKYSLEKAVLKGHEEIPTTDQIIEFSKKLNYREFLGGEP